MGPRKLALLGGHIQPRCPHPRMMPREGAEQEQEEGRVLLGAAAGGCGGVWCVTALLPARCKSVVGVTVRDDKASPLQRAGSQCEPGVKP